MVSKKKPAEKVVLTIKMTPKERKEIQDAAGGFPPSTWVRVKILELIRAEKKGGKR